MDCQIYDNKMTILSVLHVLIGLRIAPVTQNININHACGYQYNNRKIPPIIECVLFPMDLPHTLIYPEVPMQKQ